MFGTLRWAFASLQHLQHLYPQGVLEISLMESVVIELSGNGVTGVTGVTHIKMRNVRASSVEKDLSD